ncbi:hypothetical protein GCM10025876_20280 [Demequina litorisediminis]|uniref:Uncharacterized protein n=2 Tax=Demequina litorisediminis TaxID=1849022 RepID=A0ABQ6IDN2_9MICO|nr:hypothetical protein GCM10025876_20280 [Demequina litorisediminis]
MPGALVTLSKPYADDLEPKAWVALANAQVLVTHTSTDTFSVLIKDQPRETLMGVLDGFGLAQDTRILSWWSEAERAAVADAFVSLVGTSLDDDLPVPLEVGRSGLRPKGHVVVAPVACGRLPRVRIGPVEPCCEVP